MLNFRCVIIGVLCSFLSQSVSSEVFEQFFNEPIPCENPCDKSFSESSPELRKACAEGCRLYTVIELAKSLSDKNKTLGLCISACAEAFINETSTDACSYGCHQNATSKPKDDTQTLHLLTPLIYVKSAYNTMAHYMRQFISTSWTVYVQEDSGKMVILQTSPNVIESSEYSHSRDNSNSFKNYPSWQEEKLDWMDCISHQSGIPRWLLVIVLFGFILALLWLCCATAVTAPNHYLTSAAKKKNVGYVLLCEPNHDLKPSPPLVNCDEEAPPLP
ncbi:Transmembrane protein 59-like protein, partial [Stegodyphus mimosarum]